MSTMPLAQQHSPHFISSLTSIFGNGNSTKHTTSSSSRGSMSSTEDCSASSPVSSTGGHDSFEGNLSKRLSSLIPMEDIPFLTLPSLSLALSVVLQTQEDVSSLTSSTPPPSHSTLINEFLDRGVHLMDICNAISDQVSLLQQCMNPIELVIQSLDIAKGNNLRLTSGHVRRARKAISELNDFLSTINDTESQAEDASASLQHLIHRSSLRSSQRAHSETACVNPTPKRWLSWHGKCSKHLSQPAKQLQTIASTLSAPKRIDVTDLDQKLSGRIHALNVITVFFIGAIMSALPNSGKSSVITFPNTGVFSWSLSFLTLQEKVIDEIRRKGKRNKIGSLWELEQIFFIIKRLVEVTEPTGGDIIELTNDRRDEIKTLVKQLRQYMEELNKDLERLHGQIRELHHRLLSERMNILNLFSYGIIS